MFPYHSVNGTGSNVLQALAALVWVVLIIAYATFLYSITFRIGALRRF
jgi:hypothetical protein